MNIDRIKTPPLPIAASRVKVRHAETPDPVWRDNAIYAGPDLVQRKASCACGGGCPSCQSRSSDLKVSQPNDAAEIEADNTAERVLRMPAGGPKTETYEGTRIQRNENKTSMPGAGLSGGQPLDAINRAFFEARLGADLGGVRIHTGEQAAGSARSYDALAYTVGQDIVFGAGQFDPHSHSGKKLLAHELVHTVQQGSGRVSREVQRQPAPKPAAPTYGKSCSGGPTDPCQMSRCSPSDIAVIRSDMTRAMAYLNTAISALGSSVLSAETIRALDWYFTSHDPGTAATVAERLGCIKNELQDTIDNDRFGCDPDHPALAYVCSGNATPCTSKKTNVCLTDNNFYRPDRNRAEIMIHECGHRAGLSAGGNPDIYDFYNRFPFMDSAEALINTDSFADFAVAITEGVRTTVFGFPNGVGVSGGPVFPAAGGTTWMGSLNLDTEFQNPVLGLFNPTIGLRLGLIGEAVDPGNPKITADASAIFSLLAGFRLTDPRPGAAGGGFASISGGPTFALTGSGKAGIGAEVGVALGYRWRWLDVSAGLGFGYDPTRPAGLDQFVIPSLNLSFNPFVFYAPLSH